MSRVVEIDPGTVARLREKGGTWGVYQNVALDSIDAGRIQFIRFGPGCTFEAPPDPCPDTLFGTGWKYKLGGTVTATALPDDGKLTLED